ncbi:D-alanine--D-alanine ligase [Coprothermobacteraceae bacterium]|nr:D-alanine--D-alanine ligase [Coprothermobacteraceae bacterium]
MRIVVLYGGTSPEREISLRTGANVARVLAERGHEVVLLDPAVKTFIHDLLAADPDVVFPALHGAGGEDGTIQGLLSSLNIRYVGCDVRASVICLDKYLTKLVAIDQGLKTPAYIYVPIKSEVPSFDEVQRRLGVPFVVKPSDVGSTVGLSLVEDERSYISALQLAYEYTSRVILEQFVDGYEVTVGLYEENGELKTLPPIWISKPSKIFDYVTKYSPGGAQHIYELPFSGQLKSALEDAARRVCKVVGVRGVVRLDFIVNSEGPYLLEINNIPGMTETSLVPDEVAHAGMDFGEFLETLVKNAV